MKTKILAIDPTRQQQAQTTPVSLMGAYFLKIITNPLSCVSIPEHFLRLTTTHRGNYVTYSFHASKLIENHIQRLEFFNLIESACQESFDVFIICDDINVGAHWQGLALSFRDWYAAITNYPFEPLMKKYLTCFHQPDEPVAMAKEVGRTLVFESLATPDLYILRNEEWLQISDHGAIQCKSDLSEIFPVRLCRRTANTIELMSSETSLFHVNFPRISSLIDQFRKSRENALTGTISEFSDWLRQESISAEEVVGLRLHAPLMTDIDFIEYVFIEACTSNSLTVFSASLAVLIAENAQLSQPASFLLPYSSKKDVFSEAFWNDFISFIGDDEEECFALKFFNIFQ